MSLLFILLLAFSVAALAVTEGQRKVMLEKGWKLAHDQAKAIEHKFDCCGLTTVKCTEKVSFFM